MDGGAGGGYSGGYSGGGDASSYGGGDASSSMAAAAGADVLAVEALEAGMVQTAMNQANSQSSSQQQYGGHNESGSRDTVRRLRGPALSRQGSMFGSEGYKEGHKDSVSRFARFEGPHPARRGSMFGQSDHESWGYEPFGSADPPASYAQAAFRRRESMRFEEPARNASFVGAPDVSTPRRGTASGGLGRWGSWGPKAMQDAGLGNIQARHRGSRLERMSETDPAWRRPAQEGDTRDTRTSAEFPESSRPAARPGRRMTESERSMSKSPSRGEKSGVERSLPSILKMPGVERSHASMLNPNRHIAFGANDFQQAPSLQSQESASPKAPLLKQRSRMDLRSYEDFQASMTPRGVGSPRRTFERRHSNLGGLDRRQSTLGQSTLGVLQRLKSSITMTPRAKPASAAPSRQASHDSMDSEMRRGQDMEWEEERIPLYRQWVFRAVILPVAICVVANAAAAAVLVKRPHTTMGEVPLWRWLFFIAWCLPLFMITRFCIFLVFMVLENRFFTSKRFLYYLIGIKRWVSTTIFLGTIIALYWGLVCSLGVQEPRTKEARKHYLASLRSLCCLLLMSGVNVAKTMLAKLMSAHFYVEGYFDKMQDALRKEYIMLALSQPPATEFEDEGEGDGSAAATSKPAQFIAALPKLFKPRHVADQLRSTLTASMGPARARTQSTGDVTSMPSSPAKAGTLDNASMPFASAVRRTVSEQGAEPAPPPAPPLRQGSLKKSYSSRDNTVFEVEKPPPEAADDVIHAPMLPPLTFGGKSLRIPGSSLGGLAAGSNTIIEEEASEDLEADEEETDMREEGRVHQSGPSRTGGLKGGVQRSGGSSWGLPPVTEAELDVQRSMASLRSLMSMSEKPPSRLARMSSIAFSKRHSSADVRETVVEERTGRHDSAGREKKRQNVEPGFLDRLHKVEKHIRKNKLRATFTDQLGRVGGLDEVASLREAHQLAFYIFWNVKPHFQRNYITGEDLAHFLTPEHAAEAIEIFDVDHNNKVTLTEMRIAVVNVYKNRINLAATLKDTKTVVSKLERMVGAGLHLVAILFYLAIWNVNFQHIWVTVGSMLLSFTFVFGNMFKTLFECVIFLFVVHPFDVGDMISIGTVPTDPCTVEEIALLSTALVRWDGSRIMYPNVKMSTDMLINITRSGNKGDTFRILVDMSTPRQVFEALEAAVRKHLIDNPLDFTGDTAITMDKNSTAGNEPLKVVIMIYWCYKFNAANPRLGDARTSVMLCICTQLQQSGCLFSLPPQYLLADKERHEATERPPEAATQ